MAPAAPQNFWNTDAGHELKVDRERIESVLASLQSQLAILASDRDQHLGSLQKAAIELATTMAARVIHARIEASEFPIEAKVREMIAQLGVESPVSVHLHPADVELLESRLDDEPLFPGVDDPRIVPDASLSRGDCRVESREGMLLSEVVRELDDIRVDLLRNLNGNPRS